MKSWFFICVMSSIILSGCAAALTPVTAPPQILPSETPIVEPSPTTFVITATQEPAMAETATEFVIEQTATMQPSETVQPTVTSGMVMVIVGDSSPTSLSQSQPQPCQRPQGWVQYTVQRSDTLSSLGQRTGVRWQTIQSANCLERTIIFAGQILWLPFIPAPIPGATANPPTESETPSRPTP